MSLPSRSPRWLAIPVANLEEKLTRTAAPLKSYRGEGIDEDIEAFARAEATVDDPLRARLSAEEDVHGTGAPHACPVE